jgi:hypothetical protein
MGAQAAILSCSLCAVPVVPEEEGEDGGGGRSVAGGRSAANLRGDEAEEGDDGRPAADGRSVRGQTGKGSGGPVACCPGDTARHGPHGTPNTVVEWGRGRRGLPAWPRAREEE